MTRLITVWGEDETLILTAMVAEVEQAKSLLSFIQQWTGVKVHITDENGSILREFINEST